MTANEYSYPLNSMTVEETIRERQDFQKTVASFLSIASALTNEELELALARIADRMNRFSDEMKGLKWKFRGQVLKSYYDERLAGKKHRSVPKRLKEQLKFQTQLQQKWESAEEYFLSRLLEHPIIESRINNGYYVSYSKSVRI